MIACMTDFIDIGFSAPVASKLHKYDKVKQRIIDYHIQKMLSEDIIMPIDSPFASLAVLCRKNNCKSSDDSAAKRLVIDYHKLNAITQYPQFQFPVIDAILDNITNTNFMSTLDLTSGYFQIAMKAEDIPKTAFIISRGCFAFKRMSFDLPREPFTFQKAMKTILKPLLDEDVMDYLDDIIVMTTTFEEHLRLLKEVLNLLWNVGLTV